MKQIHKALLLFFGSFVLLLAYQNCAPSFKVSSGSQQSSISLGNPALPPAPAPVAEKMVSVSVGVGTNGRIVTLSNGFSKIIFADEEFTKAYHEQMTINANTRFPDSCPAGTTLLTKNYGTGCCFENDLTKCMGEGWHTDFLYRSVAFGDGKFVAVGGWDFGIARVSSDGGQTWGPRQALVNGSNLVSGVRSQAGWIGGIAYGNGRFVAVDGGGFLFWSTDGQKWTSTSDSARNKPGSAALRRIFFAGNKFYATGDNGTWGISSDGSSWEQTGVGNGVESLVEIDGVFYGIYSQKVWSTKNLSSAWTELASVSSADQLVYLPDTKSLVAIGKWNRSVAVAPFDNWTSSGYSGGPYRSLSFGGGYIIGGGPPFSRSVDGILWERVTTTDSSDNVITTTFASGEVPASWIK